MNVVGIKIIENSTGRGAYSLTIKLSLSYITSIFNQPNQHPLVALSSKINIDDRIEFQAMLLRRDQDDIINFVKFTNLEENNEADHIIYYKHTKESDTNIINKQFTVDDSWHSVGNVVIPATYVVELKTTIAPLVMSCAAILDDTDLTDFELRGVDGSLHMHKAVAAACSPYFQTLFAGSWQESNNRILDVPDMPVSTLHQLKDYMYLGTVPESEDIKNLLLLSSLYMMSDLEKRCVFKLCENLNTQTAYDLIEFAANHKMSQLLFEILRLVQNGKLDVDEMINQHNLAPIQLRNCHN